jgi:murein DD-endopeptidase MepM/ murein hydrolase activator NlpD
MKYVVLVFIFLFPLTSFGQLSDKQIRQLKGGRNITDTSFIYSLPYISGKRCLLIQAYNSKMSHAGELSLDFKMKVGTEICAARGGIVEAIKEDSEKGGLKNEFMNDGNYIIIRHYDGSVAMYWHLKKEGVLVNAGDSVKQGQHIGYSGNTGYSAFPHLHFQVQDNNGNDIPTRFFTTKGIQYLKPAKWHQAIKTAGN